MLTPLLLADLVKLLGLGGSAALVVTTAIALYHGRSLLLLLGRLGTWLRAAGVIAMGAVLAAAGFVPGVRLTIDLTALANAAGDLWQALPVNKLLSRLPLG